jgi:hypothetical protein
MINVSGETYTFLLDAAKYYAHNMGGMSPSELYIAFKKSKEAKKLINIRPFEYFMKNYKEFLNVELLREIFQIGIEDYGTTLTFGEFLECIIFNNYKTNKAKNSFGNRRYVWNRLHRIKGFRQKNSYVKKPEHKEKEVTEEDLKNKDWRDIKGINKDRKRNRKSNQRKKWAKKFSNRHIRREENAKARELSEDASDYDHKKYKNNHWMWD